jgi:hypothetical protein
MSVDRSSKPENGDYFRGAENGERVRQWRSAHPGYWRRRGNKRSSVEEPLQDTSPSQDPVNQEVTTSAISDALQDICAMQPTVLVGLIATMTGDALQEDIVARLRLFSTRGQDIMRRWPRSSLSQNENQTSSLPRTGAARAAPV